MSLTDKFIFPPLTTDIVLIGEILIDRIKDEFTQNTTDVFGGSPANISLNLKSLGLNPLFFGTVGNDSAGSFLKSELVKSGLDVSEIRTVKKDTTVVSITKTSGTTIPSFFRSSDYHINWTSGLEKEIVKTKILHFSYWPLSIEPSKSTVLTAIDVAKENNILIGFDPNYHSDIDISGGKDIDLILEVLKKVDIIKPSLDDSIRLFGSGYTNLEYIAKYKSFGCKLIIMTLGKDGLLAAFDNEIIELPSFAEEVVDATGAGDAFWAGLYSGIINGESIIDAMYIGLECSAYNLKNVGARCDFPSYNDIKTKLKIG